MNELDGYERNLEYYRERVNELAHVINHMDVHCASFCVESDGVRVALVRELLNNALCCNIIEVYDLLNEYVKPSMIAQIVDDAMEYAKSQTGIAQDKRDPLKNIDMEAEQARLHEELKAMGIKASRPDYEAEKEATDPGQEAR